MTVMRTDPSLTQNSAGGVGPSGETDAPRVLKQRFVLEEKLGSGGMGTAFRAKDLRKVEARDRQPYLAIKVLNNDFRKHPEAFVALQREAVKSQSVSHPNIVSIYDFDKDGDLPFITMELLEGQELADLLRAYSTGLPDEMAWGVIRSVCAGLRHAHEAGIVHADFKPGNVFVSPRNRAKILDFGIARAVQLTEAAGDDTVFDPSRLAALTPAYASREMINGDNPEPRDDLYSLGVVIYLIVTGHHPFGRLSAVDAAKEGLVPEKPKRLSWRQWKAVKQCLSFNRQDRPASMAEVEDLLFKPSPWRSRTALAAAAAFALALGLNFLVDDAELTDVKQEVRQDTLVDAQVSRISALLETPRFDDNWDEQLDQELATLRSLPDSQEVVDAMLQKITAAYTSEIALTADLSESLRLMNRGREFGVLDQALLTVNTLAEIRLAETLNAARPTNEWLALLREELLRIEEIQPVSSALQRQKLEVADVLLRTIEAGITDTDADTDVDVARELLEQLSELEFDLETIERGRNLVERAALAEAKAEQIQQAERQQASQSLRLDELLAVSCMRLDLETVRDQLAAYTGPAARQEQLLDARLGECLTQLALLDPDRAAQLQGQAKSLFGRTLAATSQKIVDPCGLQYLIGNGAQSGRRGYCSDELEDGTQGPRLVVLPTAEGPGRFAMTKHEVTWEEFSVFCEDTGVCSAETMQPRLPVTEISLSTARKFAGWLSQRSGFTYRLPTVEEWLWAARGQPDPNRNCKVQLDGLQRGVGPVAANTGQVNDFGLVNMLGNVQEWVVDSDDIIAVGGAFSDPINECIPQTARGHGGEADSSTGFRLVREIT
jgi:serine/threonine protein kinase